MPSLLPVEVVERVIDFSHDDRAVLQAWTTTSSIFRPAAMSHLYCTIRLRALPYGILSSIDEWEFNFPSALLFARSVILMGSVYSMRYACNYVDFDILHVVLEHLPRCVELCVGNTTWRSAVHLRDPPVLMQRIRRLTLFDVVVACPQADFVELCAAATTVNSLLIINPFWTRLIPSALNVRHSTSKCRLTSLYFSTLSDDNFDRVSSLILASAESLEYIHLVVDVMEIDEEQAPVTCTGITTRIDYSGLADGDTDLELRIFGAIPWDLLDSNLCKGVALKNMTVTVVTHRRVSVATWTEFFNDNTPQFNAKGGRVILTVSSNGPEYPAVGMIGV
ncbi:hypothetical protein PsYK624_133210 [Phanerochaete sordida]|uniref:Uncharacterized protein n=1 Tax=Phanerochaete sordida TaxID=48140 RepID=A0A9P3GPD0_9APHY|nr:hypothetical protein PsYK624_133210 [Phanerochaete sordida]